MPDNFVFVHNHVPARRVEVSVPEQLCRAVERQPAVHRFGREEPPQVVGLKDDGCAVLIALAEFAAGVA